MDKAKLITRISEALQARAPEANRKGWYFKVADALDCHFDSVRIWTYGEGCPDAASLLKLFAHFGPAFECEVRGTEQQQSEAEQTLEQVRALVNAPKGRVG